MKTTMRWLLAAVTVLDIVFVLSFMSGGSAPSMAESTPPDSAVADTGVKADADAQAGPTEAEPENWKLLGEELARRSEQLKLREQEADEILRGAEVLARAGIPTGEDAAKGVAGASLEPGRKPSADFLRLQRAYENMEPDSAAMAMIELAKRDTNVVVELLLGWKPRTSGAVLDAITVRNAKLAADLSFRIWKRRGENGPVAAK